MLLFEVGSVEIQGMATVILFGLIFYLMTELRMIRREMRAKQPATAGNSQLQLQAYERLVILSERISIPNLVSRSNQSGFGSKEMHLLLLNTIKQEYEYNASQQIYVSPVAWDAVKNLKDQNMLIINQVATSLPEGASGLDLNKKLMDFVITQKKGNIHAIVLEALNYEAKKLMK